MPDPLPVLRLSGAAGWPLLCLGRLWHGRFRATSRAAQPHQRRSIATAPASGTTGREPRFRQAVPPVAVWLAGLALLAVALVQAPTCAPMVDPENIQDLVTEPAGWPRAGQSIAQAFVSTRNGLSAIDVLVVRDPDVSAASLTLMLHLGTPNGPLIAAFDVPSTAAHNDRVRFSFPVQADSAGKTYLLYAVSEARERQALTLWATSEPVYPQGARFVNGKPVPGALTFRLFYQYSGSGLIEDLGALHLSRVIPVVVLLAVLVLPGLALSTVIWRATPLDWPARIGIAVSASAAMVPLVIGGATVAGIRADRLFLFANLAVLGVVGARIARTWWQDREQVHRRVHESAAATTIGMLVLGGWTIATRLIVVRDLTWPLWVDSVHHTLIADLIAEGGQVPNSFGPFVPPQPFTYHFGFHGIVAIAHWFTGAENAWLVLVAGQLLGGLIVFPVYALARHVSASNWAGLVAATCVGCVSTMPAYYVSWGRYPQLAGLVVLPGALLALWFATERTRVSGNVKRLVLLTSVGQIVGAMLLSAGLVLTHPRIALLFGACALAAVIVQSVADMQAREWAGLVWRWGVTGAVGIGAMIIVLPWLARLRASPPGSRLLAAIDAPLATFGWPGYGGYDDMLIYLAIVGLIAGTVWRPWAAATMVLWLAFVWLLVNPQALWLPMSFALTSSAVEIALFLPIALGVALLAGGIARVIRSRTTFIPDLHRIVVVSTLVVAFVLSGNLLGTVNPATVLHSQSDQAAIAWIRKHLPPNARFLINAAPWQNNVYAGTDGGYWIPAVASRSVTTPPLVYDSGTSDDVRHIEFVSAAVANWNGDPAILDRLIARERVTHIYVGARFGPLRPNVLKALGYPIVYATDRAWIFGATRGAP